MAHPGTATGKSDIKVFLTCGDVRFGLEKVEKYKLKIQLRVKKSFASRLTQIGFILCSFGIGFTWCICSLETYWYVEWGKTIHLRRPCGSELTTG